MASGHDRLGVVEQGQLSTQYRVLCTRYPDGDTSTRNLQCPHALTPYHAVTEEVAVNVGASEVMIVALYILGIAVAVGGVLGVYWLFTRNRE